MVDVDVAAKPSRWRSRLFVAGLLFLVVAVVAALILGIRSVQRTREYELAVERYRAAGCPMDPLAFAPAVLPPGRNGAAKYFPALDLNEDSFLNDPPESKKVVVGTDPRLEIPDGEEWSEEEWRQRRALVQEYAAQIRELKEAAAAGPVRFPLHYEHRWAMLMPHVSRLIAAAKLLSWDARCAAKDGKFAQAWESVDAIHAASDAIETEPPMVSQLVRLLVFEVGLEAMEALLPTAEPPPPAVRARLEQRLAPDRFREGVRKSCLMEMAMVQDTIAQVVVGGKMLPELDDHRRGLGGMMVLLEYKRAGARCLDRLGQLHALLDQPAATAFPQMDAVLDGFNKDPGHFNFLIPGIARCLRREGELSARVLLAREALQIRYGAPDAVPILPKDPLAGRPLLFTRMEKGFSLQLDMTPTEQKDLWKLEKPPSWSCPR